MRTVADTPSLKNVIELLKGHTQIAGWMHVLSIPPDPAHLTVLVKTCLSSTECYSLHHRAQGITMQLRKKV